jgi:hypothetical protein
MKLSLLPAPAIALLCAQLLLAQANIDTRVTQANVDPALAKAGAGADQPKLQAPGKSSAANPDCRPEPVITAKGIEYTGCSDKPEHVDRSQFEPKSAAGIQNPGQVSLDLDPPTRAKYQEALQAKYDYEAFSFLHAKRTFEFQYWSGQIIFWVVLLIVFAGLAFSAVQFYVGIRHPLDSQAKSQRKESPANVECVSEFEATLQGIKLKSSVLGLLILAMSMVFFYLYLKFVYPISNLSQ